jgi:hypothetical protein
MCYRFTKRSIIGGDLNLPCADWKGNAGCNSGAQAFINSLVWENGFTQVVGSPSRRDASLDVYLVRSETSVSSSSTVQGVSDHQGEILEVKWQDFFCEPPVERLVPVYNKTDVSGLQTFLRDKFAGWASNGSSVEEIWNNFKNIVCETIERFVPHKVLRKNSDPEYYNKEIKRLKSKVRKAYNKRKFGGHYSEKLKQLPKQLLAAKTSAQEAFLKSILSREGKCWSEFYKYVKRRKRNRETIPAIEDCNGRIITDSIEKANSLNFYYSTVFSSEDNIPQIDVQVENTGDPFTIDIKTIRRRINAIGKNKSVGPDRVSGEILNWVGKP